MIWAPPALNSSQHIGNSISTSQCFLFLVPAARAVPSPLPITGLYVDRVPVPASDNPFSALLLHPLDQWHLVNASQFLLVQPELPNEGPSAQPSA